MIFAILIAFFSIIALMVIHEFGHFIAAKKCGINVDEFGVGYPPRIYGKKFGDTLYSINLIPFGAFVRIHGEEGGVEDFTSFGSLVVWKRMLIILGGVISFWIAAVIIFTVVFNIGVSLPISDDAPLSGTQVKIIATTPNSPAESAGLKSGDVIVKINGKDISTVKDLQEIIAINKGKIMSVEANRGGQIVNLSMTSRVNPPANEGPTGLVLERTLSVIEKYPWYETPFRAVYFCGELTVKSVFALSQLVSGLFVGKGLPQGASPSGPIGITVYLAQATQAGVGFFLYFIGAISVLLAIFNLLPIPALDGGKFLFLIIEAIRKKPVSEKIEQRITMVFFFLLIGTSLLVTIWFDIPNLLHFIKNGY